MKGVIKMAYAMEKVLNSIHMAYWFQSDSTRMENWTEKWDDILKMERLNLKVCLRIIEEMDNQKNITKTVSYSVLFSLEMGKK